MALSTIRTTLCPIASLELYAAGNTSERIRLVSYRAKMFMHSLSAVQFMMVGLSKDYKIGQVIIKPIPIYMMNMLVCQKFSTQMLLHYHAMLWATLLRRMLPLLVLPNSIAASILHRNSCVLERAPDFPLICAEHLRDFAAGFGFVLIGQPCSIFKLIYRDKSPAGLAWRIN